MNSRDPNTGWYAGKSHLEQFKAGVNAYDSDADANNKIQRLQIHEQQMELLRRFPNGVTKPRRKEKFVPNAETISKRRETLYYKIVVAPLREISSFLMTACLFVSSGILAVLSAHAFLWIAKGSIDTWTTVPGTRWTIFERGGLPLDQYSEGVHFLAKLEAWGGSIGAVVLAGLGILSIVMLRKKGSLALTRLFMFTLFAFFALTPWINVSHTFHTILKTDQIIALCFSVALISVGICLPISIYSWDMLKRNPPK